MSRLKRVMNPESRELQELSVALGPDDAMEACRGAAQDLGWTSEPGQGEGWLTVHEDFTRLHCGDAPIRMEVQVRPENGGARSTVDVEAIVPGVGTPSSRHLSKGTLAFALSLSRRAERFGA